MASIFARTIPTVWTRRFLNKERSIWKRSLGSNIDFVYFSLTNTFELINGFLNEFIVVNIALIQRLL